MDHLTYDGAAPALRSRQGLAVLTATVLGSSMAFLDATVVNLALPTIGRDLDGGVAVQTWIVNGYTLTLASLILVGGVLGDRLGHRFVFGLGVAWFTVMSAACALAPTAEVLVAARVGQGIGAALLTPASLALLRASVREQDRGRAIGLWSGLTGVASVLGPLLGGAAIEAGSWRWVFLVNLPLGVAVLLVTALALVGRPGVRGRADWPGAVLLVLSLGGLSFGLTAWAEQPLVAAEVSGPLVLGSVAAAAFVVWQGRAAHPLLPPAIWSSRAFVWVNVATLLIYGALSGVFLWVAVQLQTVAGFSAVVAGLCFIPVTILMLLFSPLAGAWGDRVGPRTPMTIGTVLAAVSVLWLSRLDADVSYVLDVLGPATLLGVALTVTVTPLTSAALSSLADDLSGVASGANNAVARTGGLLVIAVLPVVTSLGAGGFADATTLADAFGVAMLACAGLLVAAGAVSLCLVPGGVLGQDEPAPSPEACASSWNCSLPVPPLDDVRHHD